MGKTKQADKKEFRKDQQVIEIPLDMMKGWIKRDKKRKQIYICYDGDDCLEIYRDKEEHEWMGTYNLNTGICDYYISKFSGCKPNFLKYNIHIPAMNMNINKFKGVRVDW